MNVTSTAFPATVAAANAAVERYDSAARKCKSFTACVLGGIAAAARAYRIPDKRNRRQRNFIEQNLLDENLGPEIRRVLR